ncbi:MAG: Hint domain-containing protein [Paracoccaceae bacterium]
MGCLTIGSMIATVDGERAVETLVAGDKLITRDNGIQRIRRVRRRDINWSQLKLNQHLQPIRLRRAAFGPGLPESDILVSPNLRLMVSRNRTALYLDEPEALVAAKHLVDHDSVHLIQSIGTTYFHIECARPELILVDGIWVECFNFAASFAAALGNAQRTEIRELFPEEEQNAALSRTGAEILQYRPRATSH